MGSVALLTHPVKLTFGFLAFCLDCWFLSMRTAVELTAFEPRQLLALGSLLHVATGSSALLVMLAEVTGQAVVHAFGSTRQPVSCISMRLPHACKQAWHAAAAVVGFDPSAGTPSAGKDGHVTRKPTPFVSHGWMVRAKGTLLGTTAGAAPAGFAAHLFTT